MILFRLAAGKTPDDVLNWASRLGGPLPGELKGVTTSMAPGGANFMAGELAPGEYALLCFVPDAGDQRPGVAHGMVRRVRVT